jgi:hypothetical protein
MVLYYDIETPSGVIQLRKPMGRVGAIHLGIITKYMPANKKKEGDPLSPAEQERIGEGFEQWAAKVLPQILMSFTPKGASAPTPNATVDDLAGEDQYGAFLAICSTLDGSQDFFRIIQK